MNILSPKHFIPVWLFSILVLSLQSCDDQSVKLEKSKVQFSLFAGTTSEGGVRDIVFPEDARLRITIQSNSGTPVFTNHEIRVQNGGEGPGTDALELLPGNYVITDFMIVDGSEVLNATPKRQSPFSEFVSHSVPYSFSVTETSVVTLGMQVIDVRNQKAEAFGYASFKQNTVNKLSFIVFKPKGGQTSLREATAELRLGKYLVKKFSVKPGMNTVAFEGDPDAVYTLSVYAGEAAKVETFNFKALKAELGAKPLRITLEPALLLSIESYMEEGNEYYSHFLLEGTGVVNINWGDGYEESVNLPFEGPHEYTMGTYTVVVTGDLDQITNLWHFSYGDIMYAITGLTNLTALKTYDPSWGAVPVKVNLSNCENLETIRIQKYGAPYEPIDLRTDFQLPEEHFIREFLFDASNENVSAEVLEVFVDNIYNNTTERSIYGGTFYVYLEESPLPETQQKLDILKNDYNWDVRLGASIWDIWVEGSEAGRTRQDSDTRRENWLRDKFPDRKHTSRGAKMATTH